MQEQPNSEKEDIEQGEYSPAIIGELCDGLRDVLRDLLLSEKLAQQSRCRD